MEKQLLQQLFQQNKQPVLGFDAEYRVFWMNEAACRQFPDILEEMDIRKAFPGFSFAGLGGPSGLDAPVTLQAEDGQSRITLLGFCEEEPFYAAIWSDHRMYALRQDDTTSAEGVELMDAWMRRDVFHIFNHLEKLGQLMEQNGITAGTDSLERIEKSCQQLLRLGINLRGYYGSSREQDSMAEPVYMGEFLNELFRQADFRLEASGIRLMRQDQSGLSVCRIEKRRFAAAILNLIDLSAAYLPADGEMWFIMSHTDRQFCITFSDPSMPAGLLSGGLNCMETGQQDGRSSMILPKVSFGFLDRVVRECGGRCLLREENPGIRVGIRLPLCTEKPLLTVRDESAYTARFRGLNRTSLVSILLSDLE